MDFEIPNGKYDTQQVAVHITKPAPNFLNFDTNTPISLFNLQLSFTPDLGIYLSLWKHSWTLSAKYHHRARHTSLEKPNCGFSYLRLISEASQTWVRISRSKNLAICILQAAQVEVVSTRRNRTGDRDWKISCKCLCRKLLGNCVPVEFPCLNTVWEHSAVSGNVRSTLRDRLFRKPLVQNKTLKPRKQAWIRGRDILPPVDIALLGWILSIAEILGVLLSCVVAKNCFH